MEFVFEKSEWDLTLEALQPGDKLSAALCLNLFEDFSEAEVEDALSAVGEKGVILDISDLPKDNGSGEFAAQLQQEQKLAESGALLQNLDEDSPLAMYLGELAGIAVAGDVDLLAQRYAAGDRTLAQELVNLSLSRVVERACAMTGRGVLLLDLIQEASLGLWQGVLSYAGGDFVKYTNRFIDHFLRKAVLMQARANGIGRKMRQGMEDYRDVDQRLLSELGRNPTLEEIAEAMHISVQEAAAFEEMLAQARARQQIDQSRAPKEETPDDQQAVEDTAYFQTRQRILELLSTLSEQETKVLVLRYGLEGSLPKTPQQTADALGLTLNEVRKLESVALRKLRQQAK